MHTTGAISLIELLNIKEALLIEHQNCGFATVAADIRIALRAINHAIQFIEKKQREREG